MALDWFFLALIATLFWSVGAILVKFVRLNYIKSPIGYIVITAPSCFIGLFLLFFGPLHIPPLKMIIYILINAIVALLGYWIYITAIHKEEISKVITLFGIRPVIVLLLATTFLKEVLSLKDYLAFPLVVVGSILIAINKKEEFKVSQGIMLTFISIVLFSISSIFLKLAAEVDFVSLMIIRWSAMFFIILTLFVFSKEVRKRTHEDLKQLNKKKIFLVYAAESIGAIGAVFSYLAIQRGSVSLVNLVLNTEGLFVIVLATSVSIFIPKILKEEITKKTISLKIISALLIIAGLYLIAM